MTGFADDQRVKVARDAKGVAGGTLGTVLEHTIITVLNHTVMVALDDGRRVEFDPEDLTAVCECGHDLGSHPPDPARPFAWPCRACPCDEYAQGVA